MITEIEKIKNLRDQTGLSFNEIRKAIEEANGDEVKAINILKARGVSVAEKKSGRATREGVIEAYVHNNRKIGSLIELNCETDFVAKNVEFLNLAHELVMQVASMNPKDNEEFLDQPYIKDQGLTIKDLIQQHIAKLGENIKVGGFIRFSVK